MSQPEKSSVSAVAAAFLQHERIGFINSREGSSNRFPGYTQVENTGMWIRSDQFLFSESRSKAKNAAIWLRLGFLFLMGDKLTGIDLKAPNGSEVKTTKSSLIKPVFKLNPPYGHIPKNESGNGISLSYQPTPGYRVGGYRLAENDLDIYTYEIDNTGHSFLDGINADYSGHRWYLTPGKKDQRYKGYRYMDTDEKFLFQDAIVDLAHRIFEFEITHPEEEKPLSE